MADEIEDRDVHLCRVGVVELLKALKATDEGDAPRPIETRRMASGAVKIAEQ